MHTNKFILFIFAAVTAFCLFSCSSMEWKKASYQSEKIEIDSKAYALPFEMVWEDGVFDGGTSIFILKDAKGQFLKLCIDGKIDSKTKGEYFLYVKYPTDENAKLVTDKTDKDKLDAIFEFDGVLSKTKGNR